MSIFLKKIFITFNILLIFLTLGAYIAPGINPDQVSFFSILGLGYPILLILNLVFILVWIFVDIKYCLMSLLIIAIGFMHFKAFFATNVNQQTTTPHQFSVISFNIGNAIGGYHKEASKKAEKKAKLLDFLSRMSDEDVICLQEVGSYGRDIIGKAFTNYEKYITEKGAVILSKHQIIKRGELDFNTITNSCLWADLKIGLDTFRVYSVHLQSNAITTDTDKVLDLNQNDNSKRWNGIKGIFKKYVHSHIIRTRQAKIVSEHINDCRHPIILCGDINDSPLTYTYRTFSKILVDNFVEAGNGIGTTFNGKIPLLRIDYIFTSKDLKVHNFNIIKESYSDHYPVASLLSKQ